MLAQKLRYHSENKVLLLSSTAGHSYKNRKWRLSASVCSALAPSFIIPLLFLDERPSSVHSPHL